MRYTTRLEDFLPVPVPLEASTNSAEVAEFTTDSSWQPVKLDCCVDMPNVLDLASLRWDNGGWPQEG